MQGTSIPYKYSLISSNSLAFQASFVEGEVEALDVDELLDGVHPKNKNVESAKSKYFFIFIFLTP
jgi:hypothetical protein